MHVLPKLLPQNANSFVTFITDKSVTFCNAHWETKHNVNIFESLNYVHCQIWKLYNQCKKGQLNVQKYHIIIICCLGLCNSKTDAPLRLHCVCRLLQETLSTSYILSKRVLLKQIVISPWSFWTKNLDGLVLNLTKIALERPYQLLTLGCFFLRAQINLSP